MTSELSGRRLAGGRVERPFGDIGAVLAALLGLFQSLFCRADFVKCCVFHNGAGAPGGRPFESQLRAREEVRVFSLQIACGHPAVFGVNFDPDAVAARSESRNHRRAGSAERIEDGVAAEREHSHQTRRQFQRERRRMMPGGGARQVPDLLKPAVKLFF